MAVEIIQFIRQNGVKVKHVLPYHPALTGAEEHSEHVAKLALTKPLLDAKTITIFLTLTVREVEVALVGNQCHGVARWFKGRIYQVKGPHTYLVHCRNLVKFVHVDHLKKTAYQSSSSDVEE